MLRNTAKTFSPTVLALIFICSGFGRAVAQTIIMQDGATISECSGIFYDTGGPSANYSNNENLTMTICPTGGAGSGPNTEVEFTLWTVQGGTVDQLSIYNGTTTVSLIATGNGNSSLLGQTFISTDPSGCLTFQWVSNATVTAPGWAALINTGPNAGTNGIATVCSNVPPFALLGLLGGTPDGGGTWTNPSSAPHTGNYNPAIDGPGNYTYTVAGPAPCADSSAVVTITEVAAPDPGISNTATFCNTNASVALISLLAGTPESGGTWTDPGAVPHGPIFNPAVNPPGIYTYTVVGTPPCANGIATVTINVNQQPDAGTNGSISVCDDDVSFSLFAQLGGTPDNTGSWTAPGNVPHSGTFQPGSDVAGDYTYTVLGTVPCSNASSTVSVSVNNAPDAGGNGSILVCSDDAPVDLFTVLGGTPDGGGSWMDPLNVAHSGTYIPGTDPQGSYTYTVSGLAPCSDDMATVLVTENTAPEAGIDGAITVCSIDANFNLFDQLTGVRDAGGTWTDPDGSAHPATFIPASSQPGIYTYTVAGIAPCSNDQATVDVSVNIAPDAGVNGNVTLCSIDSPVSLTSLLGGTPDGGGVWTDPDNALHSDQLDPAIAQSGIYTYTVPGQAPCLDAVATVNVTINTAPDAGGNIGVTLCSTDGSVDLFTILIGTPDPGGTWMAPDNTSHSGVYDPNTDESGNYTYTVAGLAPCTDASGIVNVTEIQAPDAGANSTTTVCSDDATFSLIDQLNGTPEGGGTWVGPGGPHNGIFDPLNDAAGNYVYTVVGTIPCSNASATVLVNVNIAPEAGNDANATYCETDGLVQLIGLLGGTPDQNGQWLDPNDAPVAGTFDPGSSLQGEYTYFVNGTAPCENDSSIVDITVNVPPNAGNNGSITVCDTDADVDLFLLLGGSPDINGTWKDPSNNNHNGTYEPGNDEPGIYIFTVVGLPPCADDQSSVIVIENIQPDAGSNGSIEVCSDAALFILLGELNGSPDVGGTWLDPNSVPHNGILVPADDVTGNYTYSLTGTAPCVDVSAIVAVTINVAPNAGTDGGLTTCDDVVSVDLFTGLGGNPDAGGTWFDIDVTGALSGSIFSPLGLPPNDYQFDYVVTGTGDCPDATSTVIVTIVDQLDAGSNGATTACDDETQVDLFAAVNGSPQVGGTWTDVDLTGAVSGQFFDASVQGGGVYHFNYVLQGSIGCADDSSQVTVTVTAAPDAGINGSRVVCSEGDFFDLFSELNGSPQIGGIWRLGAVIQSNVYVSSTNEPGNYTYTVTGTGPCADAVSIVTVTEVLAPYAGEDSITTVCSTSATFDLFDLLVGADPTGSWTFMSLPHSGIFEPGDSQEGVYVYTVDGTWPCLDASAAVTVSVNDASDAGVSSAETICDDDPPFLLISFLGGDPDLNGTWMDPTPAIHTGIFTPGTDVPGTYEYTVLGLPSCPDASSTVTIFVNDAPDAGNNGSANVCSNGPAINLFDSLLGTPDPTGTWRDPIMAVHNGTYIPGISTPGNYTYLVNAITPCVDDSSVVTVIEEQAPDPGSSNTLIICDDESTFLLIGVLNGSPDLNGMWTDPGGQPHTGIYEPGNSTPGTYTYTVLGLGACANDSAKVTIFENDAPFAGTNGSVTVCSNDGSFLLFDSLNGNPDIGGSWIGPGNTPSTGIFNPGASTQGQYKYIVNGVEPCVNDTAMVTVVVNTAPNAGDNGLTTVCDSDPNFNLIDHITGIHDLNGDWTDPSNVPHNGIFVPGNDTAGIYTYTVNGQSPCAPSVATVTVIVNAEPWPGTDGLVSGCSSDAQFDLIDMLGGTPDMTGSWSFDGNPHSGTFIPGIDVAGSYTYTVEGLAPCTDQSATVEVLQTTAPDAGQNNSLQVCTDQTPFDLIDHLGGTPDDTGFWLDPSLASHSGTFIPGVDPNGTYTYFVVGNSPCVNDSSIMQMTNVLAPNAGVGGGLTTCENDPGVDLFNGLSGNPDLNGVWNDDDNTGQLNGAIFDANGLVVTDYHFTYTVGGNGPCNDASTTVTVTLTLQLDAGINNSITACDNEVAIDLFNALDGTPQPGGMWTDICGSGGLTGGFLDASMAGQGICDYRYIIEGSGACISDTSYVQVEILPGPNAGIDVSVPVCSDVPAFDMFIILNGSPQTGGSWFDPLMLPHSETFEPAVDQSGDYTYVVNAVGPCVNDSSVVSVSVTEAPDAGQDSSYSACADDGSINLFTLLAGTPSPTGTWEGPNGPFPGGIFNPASDDEGDYIYTVQANFPCTDASATVSITVDQPANAGGVGAETVCENDVPFDMITVLTGIPDAGGFWLDTALNPHGDFFVPGVDPDGTYTYVVEGTGACSNDTSIVFINQTIPPDAGIGSTIDTCETTTVLDLIIGLSGNFQFNGNWEDVDLTGALAGSVFDPSIPGPGTYLFYYIVPGSSPCSDDTASVTVNVSLGPDAGIADTTDVCSSDCSYDLFNALLGSPQTNGTWTDDSSTGALNGSILDACIVPPGSYSFTYTVTSPGCDEASSTVLITIVPGPDPGLDGTLTLCTTGSDTALIAAVGGTPANTGSWTDPSGAPHNGGMFDPAIDAPGEYVYTVPGNTICADSSSTVTVIVNQPPDAGTNGTAEVCDTLTSLDLFLILLNNPDAGGIFNDDDLTGALTGNIFNPSLVEPGDYNFTYTVTVPGCGQDNSLVKVTVHGSVSVFDVEEVCIEQDRMYTVRFSISGGESNTYEVFGVNGTLQSGIPTTFISDPIPTDEPYTIYVIDQYECNEATITGVSPCEFETDVFIPQSFSPNGDGINDEFLIPGIEAFPNNTLVVFNRWGNEVFTATGYDNVNNNWDGRSQNAAFGDELPEGTYFYILDLGNGKTPRSGNVYLNR